MSRTFTVRIDGEDASIPQRIYHDPERVSTIELTPTQRELADCLLTRHCDGFVRQKMVSRIILSKSAWVPPFVVQLVGEYVVEILDDIRKELKALDVAQYESFLRANTEFLARTEQRSISYWNCYYRHRYSREEYPGYQLMSWFRSLVK